MGSTSYLPWTVKQIEIYSTKTFKIAFQVSTYTPNTYLAIDDISLKEGKCLEIETTTVKSITTTQVTKATPNSSPNITQTPNTVSLETSTSRPIG